MLCGRACARCLDLAAWAIVRVLLSTPNVDGENDEADVANSSRPARHAQTTRTIILFDSSARKLKFSNRCISASFEKYCSTLKKIHKVEKELEEGASKEVASSVKRGKAKGKMRAGYAGVVCVEGLLLFMMCGCRVSGLGVGGHVC